MAQKTRSHVSSELKDLKRQSIVELALRSEATSGELLKWSLGALLVANGGALLAVLGSEDLRVQALGAAIDFCLGVVLAIVGGVLWSVSQALVSTDQLRRAWGSEPLEADVIPELLGPATKTSGATAFIAWISSISFFVGGCIAMASVPDDIARNRVVQAQQEASFRLKRAEAEWKRLEGDSRATSELRFAARERVEAAYTEAEISHERLRKALGGKGNQLK